MMSIVVAGQTQRLGTYSSAPPMTPFSKFGLCTWPFNHCRSFIRFSCRDRRSLGSSPKPSGVLIGHTEGITYVSAKGDGRYIISNGKDQALRLWDLRKMRSSAEFDKVATDYYGTNFDYRYVWEVIIEDLRDLKREKKTI